MNETKNFKNQEQKCLSCRRRICLFWLSEGLRVIASIIFSAMGDIFSTVAVPPPHSFTCNHTTCQ